MQGDQSWALRKVYSHNFGYSVASSSPSNYYMERLVGDSYFLNNYHFQTYLRTHTMTAAGGVQDTEYYLPQ